MTTLVDEILSPAMLSPKEQVAFDLLQQNLCSRVWRLNNLYYITDEKGRKIKFRLNIAQQKLLDNMWYFNIILKARQLGFTTFLCILFLDTALFRPNTHCGIIAHNREDAEEFFTNKVRYAYDNLPDDIREAMTAPTDSTKKLAFSNGSSIRVGTSLRSGTFYMLHISEFGKICARWPAKAKEIVTGSINTVHSGQFVFIESTAEGREGPFFEFCMTAMKRALQGVTLNPLQFRFHFFPWWKDPRYVIDRDAVIDDEMNTYFDKLSSKGIKLTRKQKNWYTTKAELQGEDMLREYPSSPEEAFNASVIGSYFSRQMATMRKEGRLTKVPYDPLYPVNVFWDIGYNDHTSLWFHQRVGVENRFINYFEGRHEGLQYYVDYLFKLPYIYGKQYMPHDGRNHSPQTGKSFEEYATGLGLRSISIVPRAKNAEEVQQGIQASRNFLDVAWIDEESCSQGVKCLDSYRKEWDPNLSEFKNKPLHDWACLPAGVKINTPRGSKNIEDFRVGDQVNINGVSANVVRSEYVGYKEIVEIDTSNRGVIRCGAGHKFFTPKGLVEAQHLEPGTVLLEEKDITSWLQSSLGTREAFTESFKESSTGYGQNGGYMSARSEINKRCSTEYYGSSGTTKPSLKHTLLCQFQTVWKTSRRAIGYVDHTLKMEENFYPNTPFKILTESGFIENLEPDTIMLKVKRINKLCSVMCGIISMGQYLKDMLSTTLTTINRAMLSVISSALHRLSILNITGKSRQSLQVMNVRMCNIEKVYDIEVEHHHCYVLSDTGAVTSNSDGADSFRCGSVGFTQVVDSFAEDLLPEYAEDI